MLRIHFLNVGHGDCTIIEHPSGRLTMIDINNSQDYDFDSFNDLVADKRRQIEAAHLDSAVLGAGPANVLGGLVPPPARTGLGGLLSPENVLADRGFSSSLLGLGALGGYDAAYADAAQDAKGELTDPIAFLQREYPGRSLFRFVLTHPDLDHMRGLKRLHETIGFTNFWDTRHTKPTPNFRSDADREDWIFYQAIRSSAKFYTRGETHFAFAHDQDGTAGGDHIEILSPTPILLASCNAAGKSNDLSLVLRIRHGTRSFLFAGDAEAEAWDDMVECYGPALKSDYLKASHHGRDSGHHSEALKHIAPRITFVSVGRKPDTDASSKYRQQCNKVASTRFYGDMELRVNDDASLRWFVQRNADK